MNKLREQELEILGKVCKENNVSIKSLHQLLKSAEKFSYENITASARKKEYLDLIDFYIKGDK
ncbi:hypothetical protein DOE78_11515 [Bacillus sp. Y1]|nr:DNA modification system-associated small protein [Bacillus sp. Y1]AYA76015.1 hypothetical protein DOE78_11515 [Bacillus sp. Y1]